MRTEKASTRRKRASLCPGCDKEQSDPESRVAPSLSVCESGAAVGTWRLPAFHGIFHEKGNDAHAAELGAHRQFTWSRTEETPSPFRNLLSQGKWIDCASISSTVQAGQIPTHET